MFARLGRNEEPLHDPWTGSGVDPLGLAPFALLAPFAPLASLAPVALSNPTDTASIAATNARVSRFIANPQATAPQGFLQARAMGCRGWVTPSPTSTVKSVTES
jgi:hypothetical protein